MNIQLKDLRPMMLAINECADLSGPNVKFALACARNIKLVIAEDKTAQEQREAICTTDCLKEEDGKPALKKTQDDEGRVIESYVFEDEDLTNEKIDELFAQEIEINLMTIQESDLPRAITPKQYLDLVTRSFTVRITPRHAASLMTTTATRDSLARRTTRSL